MVWRTKSAWTCSGNKLSRFANRSSDVPRALAKRRFSQPEALSDGNLGPEFPGATGSTPWDPSLRKKGFPKAV